MSAATIAGVAEQSAFEQLVIETLKQHTQAFDEVKHEVVAVGSVAQRTLEQATRTNGRVNGHDVALAAMLDRLESLESRNRDADLVASARKEQRQEDREKVKTAVDWARDVWPLAAAGVLFVGTVWALVVGVFG